MNKHLRTHFVGALLMAAAVLCGCSKKPADVLARVGDKEITVANFKAEFERRQALRMALPDRQTLLDQMVERETLLQQARAAGLENDAEVRRACEDVLLARYQETQIAPKVTAAKVTPEEIKAAYDHDSARYTRPAKVKLAFVFIAVNAKADSNQIAAAESRAGEILAQARLLPAETRGFGRIAADYSDDQVTRYRGGDAGWFDADGLEGLWPKEIVAAGFVLTNAGDISGVLRGKEGFYLVKKLDSRPASVTPLEQVRPLIERQLLVAKQQEIERQLKLQARAAAKVFTDPALLATVAYPNPIPDKMTAAHIPVFTGTP